MLRLPGLLLLTFISLVALAPPKPAVADYLAVAKSYAEAGVATDGTPVHREIVVVRNDSPCPYDGFNARLVWSSNNNVVLHSEEVLHEQRLESGAEVSLHFEFSANASQPHSLYEAFESQDNFPIRTDLTALWITPDCSEIDNIEWEDVIENLVLVPAEIEQQLGSHQGIQACFADGGEPSEPHAPGTYWLAFMVERTGVVSSVELLDSQLRGSPLEQCLRSQLRATTWPAFAGEPKRVKYPVLWKPTRAQEASGS